MIVKLRYMALDFYTDLLDFWEDMKGLLIAILMYYAFGYVLAVGFASLTRIEAIPSLLALPFVCFFFVLTSTYDAWLEEEKSKYLRGTIVLCLIFFSPIFFTWLGASENQTVSSWALWLKFKLSAALIFGLAFEITWAYLRRRAIKNQTPTPA